MNNEVEREINRSEKKHKVVELLSSFQTGDPTPMQYIDADHYVQHNLSVADGTAGFAELSKALGSYPEPAYVDVVRVFEDGDYVFTHVDYNFFGPKIGMDIFRFDQGKIVEHWDNLCEKPQKPNPSGHTMIDGVTEIEDISRTADNKSIVEGLIYDLLMGQNPSKIDQYFDGEDYTQHNAHIGDGTSGLMVAMKEMAEQGFVMKYTTVHKILGEGNFVLAVSEGLFGPNGGVATAFYDLFRLKEGKIVEHWDVIQTIPDDEHRKNQNGKFGFK